ncbi:hypothetical protein SISSUDRAFT_995597, partial [Sistotremastrum suecicum HHB10207 ss-3]
EVTVFALPKTKASATGEDVYWAKQQGPEDPHFALQNHFRINNPDLDSPIFSWKHSKGLRPLTKSAFMKRLSTAASYLNHADFKGHSIRIGATLEYLLRGVSFEVVKSMGRWSSDAFAVYLRKHAVIMAPYMQDTPQLEPFTRYAMPPVR